MEGVINDDDGRRTGDLRLGLHGHQIDGRPPTGLAGCIGERTLTLVGNGLSHRVRERRGLQLPYNRCALHRAPEVMDADQMDLRDQLALYCHYLQSVAASSH
jgi:hypothetical protein